MTGFIYRINPSVCFKLVLLVYVITCSLLSFQLMNKTKVEHISILPTSDTNAILNKVDEGHIVSHCQKSEFPEFRPRSQTWQKVGPNNWTLVFSAWYDERDTGWVKIIGLSVNSPNQHYCQFWYNENEHESTITQMKVSDANIIRIHSSPPRYTSCFIKCSLPDKRVPTAVSLVTGAGCSRTDNILPVINIPIKKYVRNFTVCLCPLNFQYGRAYELVEWIELNRMLGADHFIVYNYSSASNVGAVLEHYSRLGVVEIVQWPLPIGVDKWPRTKDPVEVHYFAQMASLNDCLLRSKGLSEYIVNLDLDEFVIPHSNILFSWQDIIESVPQAGVYLFLNSFFRKEWTNDQFDFSEKQKAKTYKLVTLLKVEREAEIWRPRQRSKYIARTSQVESIVTHDVNRNANGPVVQVVSQNTALLHHYRNWLKYKDTAPRVLDITVVEKYSKLLVDRVIYTWSMLNNVTMDIPIE